MTTFHDGDLSSALRRMAKRNRDEAADLLRAADNLERSAAILDRREYETVPLAAVQDAVQIDLEEAIAARAAVAKPERRPSPTIQAKMRALLSDGPLGATEFSARVGASQVHFYLALRPLLASGEIVREGPKHGPGATYRLATTGKEVVPHKPRETHLGRKPEHTTAPAVIPPAAPPALTRRGAVRKQQPRTPVEIVGACAAQPVDLKVNSATPSSIPGQIVLDMLREAGADGEKPSRLRIECGLEPTMFRKLMDALIEAGAVVREKNGTNAEQVRYRLKEFSAQLPLAKGGTAALDGRDEENRP